MLKVIIFSVNLVTLVEFELVRCLMRSDLMGKLQGGCFFGFLFFNRYEKSYMHRDVVTHVAVSCADFFITGSCDGEFMALLVIVFCLYCVVRIEGFSFW